MKKSVIDSSLKKYLWFDETDEQMVEFKKHYLRHKKNREPLPPTIKFLEGRAGFVGSGNWAYEMNGVTFEVSGYANGRGFWGTDYTIRRI